MHSHKPTPRHKMLNFFQVCLSLLNIDEDLKRDLKETIHQEMQVGWWLADRNTQMITVGL